MDEQMIDRQTDG